MKIALTGAHGVGKTTLLNALQKKLGAHSSTVVCREVPRVIASVVGSDTFFRRGENTPLRQFLILFYQIIEEGLKEDEAEIVLADRTVVDHLAYTITLFPELVATPEYQALFTGIRSWLPKYDLIIKLPIEFAAVDDGVREADDIFQEEIDQAIDQLYAQLGITPEEVRGSVEQRAEAVMRQISALER